jgi:hypothetical protein
MAKPQLPAGAAQQGAAGGRGGYGGYGGYGYTPGGRGAAGRGPPARGGAPPGPRASCAPALRGAGSPRAAWLTCSACTTKRPSLDSDLLAPAAGRGGAAGGRGRGGYDSYGCAAVLGPLLLGGYLQGTAAVCGPPAWHGRGWPAGL